MKTILSNYSDIVVKTGKLSWDKTPNTNKQENK